MNLLAFSLLLRLISSLRLSSILGHPSIDDVSLRKKLAFPKVTVHKTLDAEVLSKSGAFNLDAYPVSDIEAEIAVRGGREVEAISSISFKRSFESIGWNVVSLSFDSATPSSLYLAGYMEALVTAGEIYQWYTTNVEGTCRSRKPGLSQRFNTMLASFDALSEFGSSGKCPGAPKFKQTAELFWSQLLGLMDGYNYISSQRPELPMLSLLDFVCIQLEAQLAGDTDRCSAVVALHQDEVMVAHTTWELAREAMPKIFRFIDSKRDADQPTKLQLSSYPGMIWSSDDWMVKNRLVMLETSLDLVKTDQGEPVVPDFIKTMSAVWLANTPAEFAAFMTDCDENAFDLSDGEWFAVDLGSNDVVSIKQGNVKDKTEELKTKTVLGSFNGESPDRFQELNKAGHFASWQELYRFFATNTVISKNQGSGGGAADLKLISTSLGGSIVRAGPPPAPGTNGGYTVFNQAGQNVGKFNWSEAPVVRMIDGDFEVIQYP